VEVSQVAHRPVEEADASLGADGHDVPGEVVRLQHLGHLLVQPCP
jgi:hypothetical protein